MAVGGRIRIGVVPGFACDKRCVADEVVAAMDRSVTLQCGSRDEPCAVFCVGNGFGNAVCGPVAGVCVWCCVRYSCGAVMDLGVNVGGEC